MRTHVVGLAIVALVGAVLLPPASNARAGDGAVLAPGETLTLERAVAVALANHPARMTATAEAAAVSSVSTMCR